MEAYSVLMSVYVKENSINFAAAIESMLNQSVMTNDFVIVCDGPLTDELDSVLEHYDHAYPGLFHILRMPENVGIGAAANFGLRECKNDLVAKMDADDIAVVQRCEKQLALFEADPELAVCGGYIAEFDKDPADPFAIRAVPVSNKDIRKFAKRRQPFNNMTVMYRRRAVYEVGAYKSFRRCEDYDLYVRLLHAGFKAANLAEVLVYARVDSGALARRASWHTLSGCAGSRWNSYKLGYSSLFDVVVCVAGEFLILVCPERIRHWIYSKLLRENVSNNIQN